ncbi:MAG: hypothetical protein AAFX45_06215 [Pseudomonadota bacterium]
MKTFTTASLRKGALLGALALALSACSNADVARILSEGGEDFPNDFVGQTFPVYFATGENDGDDATTDAGVGSARFISPTQIEANIPGQPRRVYTQVGDTNEWDPGDGGFPIFITDLGAFILADNIDIGGSSGGLAAYTGFETSVDDRPAFAIYNQDSFGVLFLTSDQIGGGVETLECFDCVNLVADFDMGTIAGQVFTGSAEVEDSSIAITNNLVNGNITATGFSGDIESEWTVTPDGEDPVRVDANVTNQNVVGRFFGDEADAAVVVYEGDYEITDGEEALTGSMAGASDAGRNPGVSAF